MTQKRHPAIAAIIYAQDAEEAHEFLACWLRGDWDAIRREWRDVPEDVFPEQHADDVAIDRFAAALKEKMAESRAKGRSGWEGCDPAMLAGMLREHVEKGDPRDVALLSMMLWWHSAKTNAVAPSADADAWWAREGHRGVFPHGDRRGWEGAAKYGFDAGKRAAGQQTTTGHCERTGGCVCGGDLPRVREGCSNWVKGT